MNKELATILIKAGHIMNVLALLCSAIILGMFFTGHIDSAEGAWVGLIMTPIAFLVIGKFLSIAKKEVTERNS